MTCKRAKRWLNASVPHNGEYIRHTWHPDNPLQSHPHQVHGAVEPGRATGLILGYREGWLEYGKPHYKESFILPCDLFNNPGSISSQRPAFFHLTLQSRLMIYRYTEIWNGQLSFWAESYVVSSPDWLQLLRAAVACAILERISGLEPSYDQLFKGTWSLLQYTASVPLPVSLGVVRWCWVNFQCQGVLQFGLQWDKGLLRLQ